MQAPCVSDDPHAHAPPACCSSSQHLHCPTCSTNGYPVVVCIPGPGRPGGRCCPLCRHDGPRAPYALDRASPSSIPGVGWPGCGQCCGTAAVWPPHPLLRLALCVLLVRMPGPHLVLFLAGGEEGWGQAAQCQPRGAPTVP
eukprot:scaffold220683_cov16-Tisochrysis_lutea.AAC.3